MKKCIITILACVMFLTLSTSAKADMINSAEWYELKIDEEEITPLLERDIVPYAKYIMNVHTTITKKSSSSVGIRADVYCSQTVSKIDITFYLQKKSGSSWVTVGTNKISVDNVSNTAKSVTATGVSSGTYRGKVMARVVDKYGYSESATSYTGGITI